MSNTIEWFSGIDNYRKHTLTFGQDSNTFTLELLDVESRNVNTIHDAFEMHLSGANLPVEVLYSGGLDSECVIVACLQKNIPVVAVTMRLLYKGSPFNTHDLYYAEKFCRANEVKQVFFDLDVENFFSNGDHIPYMEPYKLTMTHVATHMWLIDQCHSFPIIGGDYSWPQLNIGKKRYSPHRHEFCFYDIFMEHKGIPGIGNMLSHSLESNIMFIKEHIKVHDDDPESVGGDDLRIRHLKNRMLANLGFGNLELRHKSYGWETLHHRTDWGNFNKLRPELIAKWNNTTSIIKWNQKLADIIGGEPGENDSYGR